MFPDALSFMVRGCDVQGRWIGDNMSVKDVSYRRFIRALVTSVHSDRDTDASMRPRSGFCVVTDVHECSRRMAEDGTGGSSFSLSPLPSLPQD